MENAIGWLTKSGLKINTEKTEICIFHRRNLVVKDVELMGLTIKTGNIMNVLGMRFDSRLKWKEHVDMAIKGANASLYGIRMIKKYFTPDETRNMITAIFYSKLLWCRSLAFQGLGKNSS